MRTDGILGSSSKLTGRLFRGFWVRERAHFHPVGQPPGGGGATGQRGWRRRRREEEERQGEKYQRGEAREGQQLRHTERHLVSGTFRRATEFLRENRFITVTLCPAGVMFADTDCCYLLIKFIFGG